MVTRGLWDWQIDLATDPVTHLRRLSPPDDAGHACDACSSKPHHSLGSIRAGSPE